MTIKDIKKLETHDKYKRSLKDEIDGLDGAPTACYLFKNFPFDGQEKEVLLVDPTLDVLKAAKQRGNEPKPRGGTLRRDGGRVLVEGIELNRVERVMRQAGLRTELAAATSSRAEGQYERIREDDPANKGHAQWRKVGDDAATMDPTYVGEDDSRLRSRVRRFTDEEQKRATMDPANPHVALDRNGVGSDEAGSRHAGYVVDAESGDVRVFQEDYVAKEVRTHHSSAVGGKPVVGAGMMDIDKDGNITRIDNKSGHYKPALRQMVVTLKALEEQGHFLDRTLVDAKGRGLQGPAAESVRKVHEKVQTVQRDLASVRDELSQLNQMTQRLPVEDLDDETRERRERLTQRMQDAKARLAEFESWFQRATEALRRLGVAPAMRDRSADVEVDLVRDVQDKSGLEIHQEDRDIDRSTVRQVLDGQGPAMLDPQGIAAKQKALKQAMFAQLRQTVIPVEGHVPVPDVLRAQLQDGLRSSPFVAALRELGKDAAQQVVKETFAALLEEAEHLYAKMPMHVDLPPSPSAASVARTPSEASPSSLRSSTGLSSSFESDPLRLSTSGEDPAARRNAQPSSYSSDLDNIPWSYDSPAEE